MIKIATWNVNSIRARWNNVSNWLKKANPDVLLLQEIKCKEESFPHADMAYLGYNYALRGQSSYNGVAIFSKYPIEIELKHLEPIDQKFSEDQEARYIEGIVNIDHKIIRVASVYVPNGSPLVEDGKTPLEECNRFLYKLDFFHRLKKRFEDNLRNSDEYFVAGGDYNVARTEMDLYNPKKSYNDVGFHPMEHRAFDMLFNLNMYDLFRDKYPDVTEYSWWDYRRSGWEMNKGWRIDYLLASEKAKQAMIDCIIDKEERSFDKASDHVPVMAILNI